MYLMSRHHDEKTLVLVFSFKIYDLSLVLVMLPLLKDPYFFFLPSLQYSFLMASKSLILSPSPGQQIIPGKIVITGLAWSGSSYIKSVEITVDGGQSWLNAELDEKKKAAVRFNFEFNWEGNEIVISSR